VPREIERSAPSVEEAVEAALEELGVSEQEVRVEIVQEPRGGFLGLGSHEAVVRVRLKSSPGEVSEEDLEEQGELAADFVEGMLSRMGISAGAEPNLEDLTMYVDIVASGPDDEDVGLLIGRHGATLEAIQEVTRVAVGQRLGRRCRVMVDVEDYRKRQRSRLASRARDIARRVQKTGREHVLDPMNPYERKVVHDAVADVPGVESSSRGDEPERRVVIRPRS
jgi:spoIIIJ-associated protein